MSTKIAPGVWSTKMSVDEIKTLFEWKLMFAKLPNKLFININNAQIELKVNQSDKSLLHYLNQLPRDMKLKVEYDRNEAHFYL